MIRVLLGAALMICSSSLAMHANEQESSDTALERWLRRVASEECEADVTHDDGYRFLATPLESGEVAACVHWPMLSDENQPPRLGVYYEGRYVSVESPAWDDALAPCFPKDDCREKLRGNQHVFETRLSHMPLAWREFLGQVRNLLDAADVPADEVVSLRTLALPAPQIANEASSEAVCLLLEREPDESRRRFVLVRPDLGVTEAVQFHGDEEIDWEQVLIKLPVRPLAYAACSMHEGDVTWIAWEGAEETSDARLHYSVGRKRGGPWASSASNSLYGATAWEPLEQRLVRLHQCGVLPSIASPVEFCDWLASVGGPTHIRPIDPLLLLMP
ncbi:MAG: hypothetical protein KDA61_05070 [Planctomycetales bacterium]|nr:hypothetical protein [Planctomycetales bacterium]